MLPEAAAAGERKVVTVLFCDLVGSTAMADGADPEDVQAGLAAYYGLVRGVLERHGAAVEKFIGDAVVGAFGAPVAHEDDAERAVRAGLAILAAVERAEAPGDGHGLAVRIGVATGEVLVNLAARLELGEAQVAGDVVNTAARLQTSAEPGTVVVGERTYQLTQSRVAYAPLPEAVVKGKATPVRRWQAIGTPPGHEAEAGVRPTTRFVGRRAELAALQAAYTRTLAGPGLELVLVTGEPGVGKSRLLAEFFGWLDRRPEDVRWRQGRCLPYGDQVTFSALAQIVKAEAGILDSDDEQAARGKLTEMVTARAALEEADRSWVTARLTPLAGLPAEPGAGQGEQFTAWRRFLQALAAEAPLVLVVEDAHWAGAQLLAFLGHLAEWAKDAPILLVVTARPEFTARAPGFGAETGGLTRLNLAPLDDAATATLLAGLLGAPLLEAGLQAALLERAGGNPLFAEQLVALLDERGALLRHGHTVTLATGEELPVPDSLSALINARLDTLPRRDKTLLSDAAVIGRVFWPGAVAALSGRNEDEACARLHDLGQAGFVARLPRSSIEGQAEFRFSHALVRDAAYQALPRALRGARHLAAASWLEAQAGDRGADTAEVVAYHALTALDLAEARHDQQAADSLRADTARRLAVAGSRAEALDVPAAERYYAKAVSLAGATHPQRAGLLCNWGRASWRVLKREQAQRALEEALGLAQARDDAPTAAAILLELAMLAEVRGDLDQQEQLTASALTLLEPLPPGDDLLRAYWGAAFHRARAGRAAEALALCRRALELAPPDSHWKPDTLIVSAWARAMLGRPAVIKDTQEAIRLARNHAHDRLAVTLNNAAEFFWLIEGPQAALAAFGESRELAMRQGSTVALAYGAANSAAAMFDLGLWDELLATAAEWRPRFDAGLGEGYIAQMEPHHAAVLCWRGSLAEAHQVLDPVLPQARRMALQDLLPALAAAVTVAAASGDKGTALSLIEEYRQALQPAAPASWYWGWTHMAGLVRACIGLGELDQARRLASAAPPSLWRHRLQLQSVKAVIAEAAGDPAAEALYAEAAAGWQQYGHHLEQGLALLGLGRCRQRDARHSDPAPLLAARAIFAQLRAVNPLAETDSLLSHYQASRTS